MQGGGLCRAALSDPKSPWTIRALTRDPTKEKAIALQKAGAEVVACDIDDPASLDKALAGAHGLYIVTAYWEYMSADREAEQARKVLDAGERAGVQHYVWSTFDDSMEFFEAMKEEDRVPMINEHYIPHFDIKHKMNGIFPKEKTTHYYTSFYFENLYVFGMTSKGVFCANTGDSVMSLISCEDIGRCAYGIFKAEDEYKCKDVYVAGDKITSKELMEVIADVTGKPYSYADVDRKTYASFGFPGAGECANMFEYYKLESDKFCGLRDLELSKKLNPKLQNAREWAESHKAELLAVGPE